MISLKKFALVCLTVGFFPIQSMEITHETIQQKKRHKTAQKEIVHFPTYFFKCGKAQEKTNAGKSLADLVTAIKDHEERTELLNWYAALVMAQVCILPRPIENWNLGDLKKLNGMLTHYLNANLDSVPGYKPGAIRHYMAMLTKKTSDYCSWWNYGRLLYIMYKINNNPHQEMKAYLTQSEIALFERFYVHLPLASQLPAVTKKFMETLETLWKHKDTYTCAAYAALEIPKAHFWYDGNGRTSRLLANMILMKAGSMPMLVGADYLDAVIAASNADNLTILADKFRDYQSKTADLENLQLTHFEISEAEKTEIQKMYKGLSFNDPNYEENLLALKIYCLETIGVLDAMEQFQPKKTWVRCEIL